MTYFPYFSLSISYILSPVLSAPFFCRRSPCTWEREHERRRVTVQNQQKVWLLHKGRKRIKMAGIRTRSRVELPCIICSFSSRKLESYKNITTIKQMLAQHEVIILEHSISVYSRWCGRMNYTSIYWITQMRHKQKFTVGKHAMFTDDALVCIHQALQVELNEKSNPSY